MLKRLARRIGLSPSEDEIQVYREYGKRTGRQAEDRGEFLGQDLRRCGPFLNAEEIWGFSVLMGH